MAPGAPAARRGDQAAARKGRRAVAAAPAAASAGLVFGLGRLMLCLLPCPSTELGSARTSPRTRRGDAAAASRIFGGDESRRRRGYDVDILRGCSVDRTSAAVQSPAAAKWTRGVGRHPRIVRRPWCRRARSTLWLRRRRDAPSDDPRRGTPRRRRDTSSDAAAAAMGHGHSHDPTPRPVLT